MDLRDIVNEKCLDPLRVEKLLAEIEQAFFESGTQYSIADFTSALSDLLAASPDPDMAVTNLSRFTSSALSKASLFNDLLHYPAWFELLMAICGSSQYFADILVRDPELFRWLTATNTLDVFPTGESLEKEIRHIEETFQNPERQLNALRRMYRREMLHIGACDILGDVTLEGITSALSVLADSILDQVVVISIGQLHVLPQKPSTQFAIIGLGKLGGNELNYSSDIDILFVYGAEGEIPDSSGKTVTYQQYFNKLAEQIIHNVTAISSEGYFYRVDTRLRPESGAGPLARSLRSYFDYYESRGELWERQMLIKGRTVAGDRDLGKAFLSGVSPFVYPRTFFQHPSESIVRIKARIESAVQGEDNIKLQAGGIRDIEFIVQALQLLNGGKDPSVQSPNTLEAIDLLVQRSLLSPLEASHLKSAYIFFRTVEHRLQFYLNTQTHQFPEKEPERDRLAMRVGLSNGVALQAKRLKHTKNVRTIFDTVLSVAPPATVTGLEAVLEVGVSEDSILRFLQDHGLQDVRQGVKNLRFLVSGSGLSQSRELDTRSRDTFRRIAEKLFLAVKETPNPDMTLDNLTILVSGFSSRQLAYKQLGEDAYRKLFLSIAGKSARISRQLAGRALLLERLPDVISRHAAPVDIVRGESLPEIKSHEELLTAIRFLAGVYTFDEVTERLTEIADSILIYSLAKAAKEHGLDKSSMVIGALGKFGTGEIVFDADLDLLFMSYDLTGVEKEKAERAAGQVVQELTRYSESGKMYDIDTRLRPEGRSAPLVVGETALRDYIGSRASLWERQSFTRFRICAGGQELGARLHNHLTDWVYESPLPADWPDQIVTMRKKTETRSRVRTNDYHDIKLGPGGMVDIEFLSQMIQLAFGRSNANLRGLKTNAVLLNSHALPHPESNEVAASYRFFRTIEAGMRLVLDNRGSVLPEDNKLDMLGRTWLNMTGMELQQRARDSANGIRKIFLSTAQELKKSHRNV